MELKKIYKFYLFFIIINIILPIKALLIFQDGGYHDLIKSYRNAFGNGAISFSIVSPNPEKGLKEFKEAEKILDDIEKNAVEDMKTYKLLQIYLAAEGFMGEAIEKEPENIYKISNPEVINLFKKEISIKKDIIKSYLDKAPKPSEPKPIVPPLPPVPPPPIPGPKPKTSILTKEDKEKFITELSNLRKPINEYKNLVHTQKSRIIEYIDELIKDISISTNDKLIQDKFNLIQDFNSKLFRIPTTGEKDKKANEAATKVLNNFSSEYNKLG